ncbi:MAG: type VI secretion system tube protein Hcp [Acidobacteria bacterium]|nr:type VI secretion system tube protein Hcp [Acidobacteriota bacterium]
MSRPATEAIGGAAHVISLNNKESTMAIADFFLKIDTIEGESGDSKHKGEIDLESWSWGESNTGTGGYGGGSGAGKVSMQDFHFVMKIGKGSPKLMLACATGQHIPKAVLTCRKAGGEQQEYLVVTFTDILISSYQTGGSGHSDVIPMDQVSFNFTKIEMDYKLQDSKGGLGGSVKTGYDVKANKKI